MDRIEGPEMNPHIYGQLVFNKEEYTMEKKQCLQQVGELDSHMQISEVRTLSHIIQKKKKEEVKTA